MFLSQLCQKKILNNFGTSLLINFIHSDIKTEINLNYVIYICKKHKQDSRFVSILPWLIRNGSICPNLFIQVSHNIQCLHTRLCGVWSVHNLVHFWQTYRLRVRGTECLWCMEGWRYCEDILTQIGAATQTAFSVNNDIKCLVSRSSGKTTWTWK